MPCQRMFNLPNNCTHLTPQNSPSQASIVHEQWTSRCSTWFYKWQKNQISNCQHLLDHWKNKRVPKDIYLCFVDYAKAFDCVDHNKQWKILQEMGISDHLTCLLKNLYEGQEATVRTGHGKTDWLQIGKGVRQGCILPPCLFNYMQSTSCEMPDWMKHKLESRLPGKIPIASDMQMTPPSWQKEKKN